MSEKKKKILEWLIRAVIIIVVILSIIVCIVMYRENLNLYHPLKKEPPVQHEVQIEPAQESLQSKEKASPQGYSPTKYNCDNIDFLTKLIDLYEQVVLANDYKKILKELQKMPIHDAEIKDRLHSLQKLSKFTRHKDYDIEERFENAIIRRIFLNETAQKDHLNWSDTLKIYLTQYFTIRKTQGDMSNTDKLILETTNFLKNDDLTSAFKLIKNLPYAETDTAIRIWLEDINIMIEARDIAKEMITITLHKTYCSKEVKNEK